MEQMGNRNRKSIGPAKAVGLPSFSTFVSSNDIALSMFAITAGRLSLAIWAQLHDAYPASRELTGAGFDLIPV